MGYSTPSVILQMIQYLKEWLMHQIGVLLFRKTLRDWRNVPRALEINKGKGHVLTTGRNNSSTSVCSIWKLVCKECPGCPGGHKVWTQVCRLYSQPRRLKVPWSALCKSVDSRIMEVILFLYSGKTNLKCWVQYWASQCERDVNRLEWVRSQGAQGLEHLAQKKRLKKLWLVSLEKKNTQRSHTPWWGSKEDKVFSRRGHKMRLKHKKNFIWEEESHTQKSCLKLRILYT